MSRVGRHLSQISFLFTWTPPETKGTADGPPMAPAAVQPGQAPPTGQAPPSISAAVEPVADGAEEVAPDEYDADELFCDMKPPETGGAVVVADQDPDELEG